MGCTAIAALEHETHFASDYPDVNSRRLYSILPRGFPMNPHSIARAVRFVQTSKETDQDRVEGFKLLEEFQRISLCFHPSLRDLAMVEILKPDVFGDRTRRPLAGAHRLWENIPIRRHAEVFSVNPRHNTHGAGIPQPDPHRQLDIDCWAQYALLHGRVGSDNFFVGIVMDHAFRVDRRSVFGYGLGRSLAPTPNKPRQEFMKYIACILAQPRLYHEAIQCWDEVHPNNPFVEATGDSIQIEHMGADSVITIETVLGHLRLNRIPPAWVDHGYPFGLHLLNHVSFAVPGYYRQLYLETNRSRLQRLALHGVPPPIPKWSGWWTPQEDDLARLHAIIRKDEHDRGRSGLDHPEWLAIGADPIFTHLAGHDLDDPTDRPDTESTPLLVDIGPGALAPPIPISSESALDTGSLAGPTGPAIGSPVTGGLGTGSWADDN